MACFHPLKAFRLGLKDNGKQDLYITPTATHHIEILKNGKIEKSYNSFVSDRCVRPVYDYVEVPCGSCIGCRLDYSRTWADRCLLEMKEHESNLFLTLTYDDEHLHLCDSFDPDTGAYLGQSMTLCKRDLQLFLKRLRKQTGQKIRYFACGEYGDKSSRPHYHLIVFGLKFDDLKLLSKSSLGYNYFTSDTLGKIWTYGNHIIAEASWETCAYTARYVVKKLNHDYAKLYDILNIEKEFVLMSRKPGIAKNAYISQKEYYAIFSGKDIATPDGSHHIGMNRYFKKLEQIEFEELSKEKTNQNILKAIQTKKMKLANTSLLYDKMLEVEEQALKNKTKCLERKI